MKTERKKNRRRRTGGREALRPLRSRERERDERRETRDEREGSKDE